MEQVWDTDCLPFNETATGWLGDQRDTMLTNQLLRKAPVGRAKVRGLIIPEPDYIYGYRQRGPWKMKDALQGWSGILPDLGPRLPSVKVKDGRKAKDLKQINRSAVLQGMVDAKTVRTFAKSHYAVPINPKESKTTSFKVGISERPLPFVPPRDMTHGHRNPPHEPMEMVLSSAYRDRWMIETKLKDSHQKSLRENQVIKAKPHLCTFPSEKVQLSTIQANAFDHVGHQGTMGQGIVTKATNQKAALESTRLERGCRVCPRVK